jgi:nucleoside-diphosphate kinase
MNPFERTFIAIKPDAIDRGLVGKIIKRFEERGYRLVGIKLIYATDEDLRVHYHDLVDMPFFPALSEYMTSGPLVGCVWEGKQFLLFLKGPQPFFS